MTCRPPVRHGTVLAMAVWLLWLITAHDPFNRRGWLLENLLVIFYCGLLLPACRCFRYSNRSGLLFTRFMSLAPERCPLYCPEVPVVSGGRRRSGCGAITMIASCAFPSVC